MIMNHVIISNDVFYFIYIFYFHIFTDMDVLIDNSSCDAGIITNPGVWYFLKRFIRILDSDS